MKKFICDLLFRILIKSKKNFNVNKVQECTLKRNLILNTNEIKENNNL